MTFYFHGSFTIMQLIDLISCIYTALRSENESQQYIKKIGDEDLELPLFDLYTVSALTSNFSFANKIGEGGFGAVYKVVSFILLDFQI